MFIYFIMWLRSVDIIRLWCWNISVTNKAVQRFLNLLCNLHNIRRGYENKWGTYLLFLYFIQCAIYSLRTWVIFFLNDCHNNRYAYFITNVVVVILPVFRKVYYLCLCLQDVSHVHRIVAIITNDCSYSTCTGFSIFIFYRQTHRVT